MECMPVVVALPTEHESQALRPSFESSLQVSRIPDTGKKRRVTGASVLFRAQ
jgi:hypothetical protein